MRIIWLLVFGLMPKKFLSFLFGHLARTQFPSFLQLKMNTLFARLYAIDLGEAEKALSEYKTSDAFFTRNLREGVRPLGDADLVHPADGQLTQIHGIHAGTTLQIKGFPYGLSDLLRVAPETLRGFDDGMALTYYLCPTDYHRVHCPMDAEEESIARISGSLWPVNSMSVSTKKGLFCVNERLVFSMKSKAHRGQRVYLVMVGALNVGHMRVPRVPEISTQDSLFGSSPRSWSFLPPLEFKKGEQLGVFHMGSTVVMIYPKGLLPGVPKQGPTRVNAALIF